jgi:hypothetical protein
MLHLHPLIMVEEKANNFNNAITETPGTIIPCKGILQWQFTLLSHALINTLAVRVQQLNYARGASVFHSSMHEVVASRPIFTVQKAGYTE